MESKTFAAGDTTNISIGAGSSANGSTTEKMVEKKKDELPTPPNLKGAENAAPFPFEPAKVSSTATSIAAGGNHTAPLKSAIKKRPTLVITVETVAEGIEEVQQAERRNFARAVSFDDCVEVFDYHPKDNQAKKNDKKKNFIWNFNSTKQSSPKQSPFRIINPFDVFTADGKVTSEAKTEKKNGSSTNKWWKKPLSPFRSSSSPKNKKATSKSKDGSRDILVQDKSPAADIPTNITEKEEIPTNKAPETINNHHDNNSNSKFKDWKALYPPYTTVPKCVQDDNVHKSNDGWLGQTGFLLMMGFLLLTTASFCFPTMSMTTTRILDGVCGPVLPGTTLGQEPATVLSFEAPWWAPEGVKSKGLFQFVCGDRPRTRLEWQLVKQAKNNKRLYRLLLVDLDGIDSTSKDNQNSRILLDKKNLVSAEIGSTTVVAVDKKESSHQFQAPWQHTSATK